MVDRLPSSGHLLTCRVFEIPNREPPGWIQVFPATPFFHPRAGIITPTPTMLATFVANRETETTDLLLDYEHQSMADPPVEAPAAGWVDRLEVRDDGLWAHVKEWMAHAQARIRAGEYRYLSPVFSLNGRSRKDGARIGPLLVSIGLVNTPQIDGMAPLAHRGGVGTPPGEAGEGPRGDSVPNHDEPFTPPPPEASMNPVLLTLLGLATTATDEQVVAEVTALQQKTGQVPAELRVELQIADTADLPTACSAVRALRRDTVPLADHAKLLTEVVQLRARNRVLQDNIPPAFQEVACRLLLGGEENYTAWKATVPRVPTDHLVPPPGKGALGGGGASTPALLDEVEMTVCRHMNLKADDFMTAKGGAA